MDSPQSSTVAIQVGRVCDRPGKLIVWYGLPLELAKYPTPPGRMAGSNWVNR
jgi:hypothetical protein